VSFDTQGGSSVSDQNWVADTTLNLPTAPEKSGFQFTGWFTSDIGGTFVGGSQSSYSPTNTSNFTLYAQWIAQRKTFPASLVTFAQNGAENNSYPQSEIQGETKALWKNVLTRSGYTFAGWNTKADGSGTAYADQAQFKFDASYVTLYAQWKLIQSKPTITWANPSPVEEGTALSATQLNALASVAGTYSYSPASSTVLKVGKQSLKVIFTPTDPKYETIEATVEIEVLAKPTITWSNPASIVEGTALSATQLNALASVPGSYTYSPASGTIPAFGKQTLNVAFKPTDSRLSSLSASVTIDVTALIPDAPLDPNYSVSGASQSTINWGAGKNAANYIVKLDGKEICSTTGLTCTYASLLGPKNKVTVNSVSATNRSSSDINARYLAPASPQTVAIVNFDTAKAKLSSADMAKLRSFANTVKKAGFTTLSAHGHTDSQAGIDNQKLSIARAKATIAYLKKLLPGVTFKINGYAAADPVADNTTEAGKAANRRAEVSIP
jgi:uncharacterized repeat protein (TIGR02543 family)